MLKYTRVYAVQFAHIPFVGNSIKLFGNMLPDFHQYVMSSGEYRAYVCILDTSVYTTCYHHQNIFCRESLFKKMLEKIMLLLYLSYEFWVKCMKAGVTKNKFTCAIFLILELIYVIRLKKNFRLKLTSESSFVPLTGFWVVPCFWKEMVFQWKTSGPIS